MKRMEGQPILTAAQMREAEKRAAPTPEAMYGLMERAGAGVAEVVHRLAAGAETLILCGPGNNGGDGYVAARVLAEHGHPVRVAALGEPTTDLARRARTGWAGLVERYEAGSPSPVVVDALFGTGLSRPLDGQTRVGLLAQIGYARLSLAVDLPSGVATDTGELLGASGAAVTLALGALKPAHVLEPAASRMGELRLLDLGLDTDARVRALAPPLLGAPLANSHKYTRGMVAIIGGAMPGAGALAAEAALRAGAGYALLLADERPSSLPHAVVVRNWDAAALGDERIGAVLIGPGLGRTKDAEARLDAALASDHRVVIDGDALHLLAKDRLERLRERGNAILTPHAGEFAHVFGQPHGSKIEATCDAARRANSIVVFKGADTVVAEPEGRVVVASRGPAWLSTAGTGDVLAGAVAAQAAGPLDPALSVPAGVWLHAEAARRCGASFIADDLAHALTVARASL